MKVNNRKGRKRALPENSTTEHAEAEDLPVASIEKDTVEQLPKDQEHVTDKRRRIKKKKNKSNAPAVEKVEFDSVEGTAFKDFDLDEIILKGVGELGWERPTQVQESVIPLAIEEKNLMVRARTGSGKTAAFVLPILHKVMQYTSSATNPPPGPYAIFIAPTKELSSQIYKLLVTLCKPFPYLRNLNLTEVDEKESAVWEKDQPELVVTTPLKMQVMLKMRPNFCTSVRHVVIDEADLLLSFGYEAEMRCIRSHLPPIYQCILTSATLTDDMSSLKALFMTGPVLTIKLKEGDLPDASQLVQYYLHVTDDEQRFAILLAMLKLRLIVGRSIIFVKNPERCYKMNLFLWAFKLKSCILNSAMPANSRCHVINQFNEGLFPIIVASDSSHLFGADNNSDQDKKKRKRLDKEAGVSRGIDFHHVSNVVNFDFPTSIESYIHRVGRTARGFNKGTALSFCTPIEKGLLMNTQKTLQEHVGRKVLQPYDIRVKELDSFVLRTQDALSKCTPHVIREMRLAEIREEALRSAKLQAYFAANPREKELLQTDKKLRKLDMVNSAIFDVPEYIVPVALRGPDYSEETRQQKRNKKRNRAGRMTLHQRRAARDAKDPLRRRRSNLRPEDHIRDIKKYYRNIMVQDQTMIQLASRHVSTTIGPLSSSSLSQLCPEDRVRLIWRTANAVCFDVDSTVCQDEAIDEFARFLGVGDQVAQVTRSAMNGNAGFRFALKARLDIMRPTRAQLECYTKENPPKMTPGICELVNSLHKRNVIVYLVSGGFRAFINPVADLLSIPRSNIFANEILFDSDGNYAGFDEKELTSDSGSKTVGKAGVVGLLKQRHNYRRVVMVGDGATDMEAAPPADAFIGFGGNQMREAVRTKADWYVMDFDTLREALNTTEE